MSKVRKNKLIEAAICDITVGGNNPRIIDEKSDGFKELAESIAAIGVFEPVHVRTDPSQKKPFELLAGERRLRAAEKSGLESIPAIDHGDIGDDEAFEITFIENYARQDLTVLEHGRAVAILLEKYKGDVTAVASKLGKDERWVRTHNCIHVNLITDFSTAVSAGGCLEYFTASHLALVARFPAETQKKIFGELLRSYGHVTVEGLEKKVTDMLRILAKAKFDTSACAKCVKRSGVQPGLWADDTSKSGDGDKCLDPDCWEKRDIAASKAEFKEKCEKYPGLVGITSDYYLNRDEGKTFRKTYGKVLVKNEYQLCKKDDKNAVPAVNVKGKGAGKIYYIKTKKDARPAANKPVTLKQRRAELDMRRWSAAIVRMIGKIKALKFGEICVQIGDDGEMQGTGILRMNLLIVLYGCDCGFYNKERGDFIGSTMKLYKSSADMTPAINQVCEKLWPIVAENLEYDVNTNGDENSKKEGMLLADLFGIDLKAGYEEVCKEPEFAEPAEWTEKKVKGKKNSATEITEDTEKVKSKKVKVKKNSATEGTEVTEKKGKGKKAGKKIVVGTCRVCGCTDDNTCLGADGEACHWVEKDLCSNCK